MQISTRREIQADTSNFMRVFVWQKVEGEEHLVCSFYVDFWLNETGEIPVAVEWTSVLRLPFGVNDPFGVEQPREKHFYGAQVFYGDNLLDSRTNLAHAQHTSWASLRSNDDPQHARKHWINLGEASIPALRIQFSNQSLKNLMLAGYIPPYDLEMEPSVPNVSSYVPLETNGHRGGGLNQGGGYPARGLISTFDAVAILRQDDLSWCRARVAAQAGLSYWFDLADHRSVQGGVRLHRIPGPVKSVTSTPSYSELGDPISCSVDSRGRVDLLVLTPDDPHGASNYRSCDEAHWPDPSYFISFIDGERYLLDAVIGSWDFSKRYFPYNSLAHDRTLLNYGRPGIPATQYGQIGAWAEERFGWGIAVLAHAFALVPQNDPHKDYLDDYTRNVRNFFRDSHQYFSQDNIDKGFINNHFSGVGALWMNNFTSLSFYLLSRVSEQLPGTNIFTTMGEISAKRCIDTWKYAASQVEAYRDIVHLKGYENIVPSKEVCWLREPRVRENRFSYPFSSLIPVPITNGDIVYLMSHNGSFSPVGEPPGGVGIKRYVVNANETSYQLSRTPAGEPEVFEEDQVFAAAMCLQKANLEHCPIPVSEWEYNKGDNYTNIAHATFQMADFNFHPSIDSALREKVKVYMSPIPKDYTWKWGYSAESFLNENNIPVIQPISNQTVYEGEKVTIDILIVDENVSDSISLTTQNLPNNAIITQTNPREWNFNWQTDFEGHAGSPYTISFTANDGQIDSEPVSVEITVNEVGTGVGLTDKSSFFKTVND